jgi:hypothetical protein
MQITEKGALGSQPQVIKLLAHGRWFSPGTSTTKTVRHDIAEILLKVALKQQNKINKKIFKK